MAVAWLALRRSPHELLPALAREPGAVLLEISDATAPATVLGCQPVAELRVEPDTVDPLGTIAAFVEATPAGDRETPFPFAGGVVTCLAYELGAHCVPGLAPRFAAGPLAVLRRYDPLLVFDRRRGRWALASASGTPVPPAWLERVAGERVVPARGALATADLRATLDRDAYRAAVTRIHAYLHAGDAYQVNFTQPFTAPLAGPASELFVRLAERDAAPHAAYLDLGDAAIVASSPELFLRRRGDRVETHPIKGTRPRGADPTRDAALAAELAADAKERAEHLMIVDLERNDLGRVAAVGSVAVEPYARVVSHPTVHHLASTVRARLRPDVGWRDLLSATFPGGSVTGAPKRRAMEIIAELEPWPRGVYTGALGLLDPRGHCELGLPIRTGVVADGVLRWHAGGGIVVDSDADRELDECWLKTAAVRAALAGDAASFERCSSG